MRILGVDYGKARIGLAICDPTETIASPLDVWPAEQADADRFLGLAQAEEIEAVVVGLPVRTDGTEGPEAQEVRVFAEWLESVLEMPVALYDERFTTQLAARSLRAGNVSGRRRRDMIDKVAAQAILESYLQHRRQSR